MPLPSRGGILCVFGNGEGLDLKQDRKSIEKSLGDRCELQFIKQPTPDKLRDRLSNNTSAIAEAIEILETLPKTGLETPPIYRNLGDLYLQKLQLIPQAQNYYSKAINAAKPDDIEELTEARYGLGQVHFVMRNNRSAMKYLRIAKDGFQTLGDLPMVEKVEKQLRDLQRREDRK